jgi:hypothetical protein
MLPMMTLEILSLSPWLPLHRTGKNCFCMFLCFRQPLFDVVFGFFLFSLCKIHTNCWCSASWLSLSTPGITIFFPSITLFAAIAREFFFSKTI